MKQPERIGRFEILRELGRGGMGVVYEARCPDLSRRLALKCVLPHVADAETLQRFTREAQAMARVRHPGVVAIHEVGHADGMPFLVSDYIAGRPLDVILKEGPLEPERAASVVAELADAVAALHQQGVLHRDLKPANVMVADDGRVVLLDFGLAREADGKTLTQTGTVMGTPAYMSPEQATGEGKVDERADVYGLGAVLFHCLAGRPPFAGASVVNVLLAVMHKDPTWPTASRGLGIVLRRAMAKDPGQRPRTAAELADDLRVASAPSEAKPVAVYGLLAAFVLVGLVGGALGIVLGTSTEAPAVDTREQVDRPKPDPVKTSANPFAALPSPNADGYVDACRAALESAPDHPDAPPARDRFAQAGLNDPTELEASPPGVVVDRRLRVSWIDDHTLLGHGATMVAPVWVWDLDKAKVPEVLPGTVDLGSQDKIAVDTGSRSIYLRDLSGGVYRYSLGSRKATLLGRLSPEALIRSMAVDPDRKRLAVGTNAGEVYLLSTEGGVPESLNAPREDPVHYLVLSPDGRYVIAGHEKPAEDGAMASVFTYDLRLRTWSRRVPVSEMRGLGVFQDGSSIVIAWANRAVQRRRLDESLDVQTAYRLAGSGSGAGAPGMNPAHEFVPRGLAVSPDGQRLYSVSGTLSHRIADEGEIKVWDARTGRLLASDRSDTRSFHGVAVSPNGRRLAITARDRHGQRVAIHEVDVPPHAVLVTATPQPVGTPEWREGYVRLRRALGPRHPSVLKLRQAFLEHSSDRQQALIELPRRRSRLQWVDGDRLIVYVEGPGGESGELILIDRSAGSVSRRIPTERGVHGVLVDPSSQRVFFPPGRGRVSSWDLDADPPRVQARWRLPDPNDLAWSFALHPAGQHVAVGTYRGWLHVFDLRRPEEPPRTCKERLGNRVNALGFSPDGRFLAGGGGSGSRFVFDLETDAHRVFRSLSASYGLATHPNHDVFVIAGDPHAVHAHRFADPRMLSIFGEGGGMTTERVHQGHPSHAVFAPDGSAVYTVAGERDDEAGFMLGEIVTWNPHSHEKLHLYSTTQRSFESVDVSPDGSWLATVSIMNQVGLRLEKQTLRIELWEVDVADPKARAGSPSELGDPATSDPKPR